MRHLRRFRPARLIFVTHRPLRRLFGGLLVGLIVGGLLAWALSKDPLRENRTRLRDVLYRPRATQDLVVIVAADNASLEAYGRSTTEWSRTVYIDLIDRLTEGGARVIAFDLLFANPTPDDDAVAEAMREARNVIQPVLGLGDAIYPTHDDDLVTYLDYIRPVPVMIDASMGVGHVNVIPDDDGFVRRIPLFVREGDQIHPALGMSAYLEYLRQLPEMVQIDTVANRVRFAGREIPIDDNGEILVYFFGGPSHPGQPSTFATYSLVDVVEGRVPPEAFADKIVLVGVLDAAALPDNFPTPVTRDFTPMYGVEIHANIVETLHQSLPAFQARVDWKLDLGLFRLPLYEGTTDFPLREQPLSSQILVTFLIAVVSSVILPYVRWYAGLPLIVLAYLGYWFWAVAAFTVDSMLMEMLFPAFALVFTYLGTMIGGYIFEERRRGQINDLFSRYVSPEIAQKVVEQFDRGRLNLGGEEREITVLFADVRGFTPLAEGLPAHEVVALLNTFLEEMSAIVMHHGGAINKYMGDNLMAFWNAPYPQDDHAWKATQAGLEMLVAIHRLNTSHQFPTPVQFGIGINTGSVVVGNVGSRQRLEYTPIGDVVNVASRFCSVAPGGSCYIGAQTRAMIGDRITPLDEHHLLLKGKAEKVTIFELRPEGIPIPENTAPLVDGP